MEGVPGGFIKLIDQRKQLGIVQTLITEQLADSGIVLLFDMSVVIFLAGSGSGKSHWAFAVEPITPEMVIDEFSATV